MHGEKHQVVLKQVHVARPTVQSLEHITVATHIPSNCSVSPGLPHNVLIDEGGHSQHLIDSQETEFHQPLKQNHLGHLQLFEGGALGPLYHQ